MRTIMLDGSLYATGKDLHRALKQMLTLPDYYGMNADALADCLSERLEPVRVCLRHAPEGEAADTLCKVRAVVEDLGGTWKEL